MNKNAKTKPSLIDLTEFATFDELCDAYCTGTRHAGDIAHSILKHIVDESGVPSELVTLDQTNRRIVINNKVGIGATLDFDFRDHTVSTRDTWNVVTGSDKCKTALNKLAHLFQRETMKILKVRVREADTIVQCAQMMGVKWDTTSINSNYHRRKQERTKHFLNNINGWKLKACASCGGSGYYDCCDAHGRSRKCGACNGTGRCRTAPIASQEQVKEK